MLAYTRLYTQRSLKSGDKAKLFTLFMPGNEIGLQVHVLAIIEVTVAEQLLLAFIDFALHTPGVSEGVSEI
jgi:hypothetical protein